MNHFETKLKEVKNPTTQQTLDQENRFHKVEFQEGVLTVIYSRDGISPENKKIIEKDIKSKLSDFNEIKEIFVKTLSKNSDDVFKSLSSQEKSSTQQSSQQNSDAPSQPAQLKVGHGTVGNKKAIPGVQKVIAIGSGKGGVGKSTFTANLALSLARTGKKVGVIDGDIYGPSMPMIFGKRDEKPRANDQKKILPVDACGIKMMSFGFFINEEDPVIWRGPMLGGVLNQFFFDVDWGTLDYLLIDLPPGTGDIQLSMIQNTQVDGAIIISTPQDIALLDAQKGLEMFKKMNLPIIGMVENMSSFICDGCGKEHFIFGKEGVEQAVKKLGTSLLGKVPLEIELRTGSDLGQPYMSQEKFLDRPVWSSFDKIASELELFFSPSSQTSVKQETQQTDTSSVPDPSAQPHVSETKKSGFFSKILGLHK